MNVGRFSALRATGGCYKYAWQDHLHSWTKATPTTEWKRWQIG